MGYVLNRGGRVRTITARKGDDVKVVHLIPGMNPISKEDWQFIEDDGYTQKLIEADVLSFIPDSKIGKEDEGGIHLGTKVFPLSESLVDNRRLVRQKSNESTSEAIEAMKEMFKEERSAFMADIKDLKDKGKVLEDKGKVLEEENKKLKVER